MFLKRLELSGFKSFASKTTLLFSDESGQFPLAAVVGPNGSGKSNIADAIRWAMGEQSPKTLRGKKSEDVIFSGTDKKARLGSATVTLVFDNADRKIPIEYDEVLITRKLFRSGESEYLINGSRSRLLDVTDLLARASIGRESSSVITQGMSDAVLSATPVERRSILESAAGVKHIQIEKDRALRKLESTKENVERVDALLSEIEPHLKHLKRQAERASKGKGVAEELRAKQVSRFSFLWHTLREERARFHAEEASFRERLSVAEARSKEVNEALQKASLQTSDADREIKLHQESARLRETMNRFERERSVALGKAEIERERQKPREIVDTLPVNLPYVRERLDEIRAHQEKLIDRLLHVESLDELQEIRELARVIETRLSELRGDAIKGAVVSKRTVTLPEAELAESRARLLEYEASARKTEESCSEAKRTLETIEASVLEERRRMEESRRQFFALEREARACQEALGALKDEANEARVRWARVEVREEDVSAEIREELHVEPDALRWDGVSLDPEALERDIARLKVELERIGGIDPLVVEECAETEKRFEFLSRESEDLKRATETLREVAREMDEQMREAFETAFDGVNREFRRYFEIIFGGGKAELARVRVPRRRRESALGGSVLDEDIAPDDADIVEDGIEIIASPPGKKIAHLSMLSGGERSLTSLALLFAIISHNPPPFAVLDEVEAALDESNSKRFGKLLGELSSGTQFVAITHNRETMRRASILYGVTMGDDGVSKILSVRLDQVGQGGKIAKTGVDKE